jgi:hypothetical protein
MYHVMVDLLNWYKHSSGEVYVGRLKAEQINEHKGPLRIFYTFPNTEHVTDFKEINNIKELLVVDPTGKVIADLMEVLTEEFVLEYKEGIGYENLLKESNKKRLTLIQKEKLR